MSFEDASKTLGLDRVPKALTSVTCVPLNLKIVKGTSGPGGDPRRVVVAPAIPSFSWGSKTDLWTELACTLGCVFTAGAFHATNGPPSPRNGR